MKSNKNVRVLRKKIAKLEQKLARNHAKLADLRRKLPREPVKDYLLAGWRRHARLSALFGDKDDLLLIHNLGRSSRHCTMWADGFNGLLPHLADRAAFVVLSPDRPAVQHAFAQSRGWRFPMFSSAGSSISRDLGFEPEPDEPLPGVSALVKQGRRIYRVASARFGPFDPFCSAWPLFALLARGVDGWAPRFRYLRRSAADQP